MDGKWVMWFDDGKIAAEEEYLMGKRNGTWRYYYPNGNLKAEWIFVNGKTQSKKEWSETGILMDAISTEEII